MLKTGDSSAKHRNSTVLDRMLDSSTYLRIRDEANTQMRTYSNVWVVAIRDCMVDQASDGRSWGGSVHCSLFRVLLAGVMEIVLFRSLRLCGAYGRNRTGMVIGACIHYLERVSGDTKLLPSFVLAL